MGDLVEELQAAKEAYREDKSEENRERFHTARDAIQAQRASTRTSGAPVIVADEVVG